ncbi:MAG: formate dehydrogenase [Rubrivivax sp.]|nr:formate dehydrogenase [Rubrivivax sp.]
MNRRRVFAGVATAGAVAGVAAVLPAARAVDTPVAAQPTAPGEGGGYQATAHVLRYYETARV